MGQDKSREKKKLIIYLDDSNDVKQAYVIIEEIGDQFITFRTEENRISLPISRVLKIKEAI
jgi:hypothetical protein